MYDIILSYMVKCRGAECHLQLWTFGCIQWKCELYSGRPKGRCYPFGPWRATASRERKPLGAAYDMISYMISLLKYVIIYEIIFDLLL